jgi:hypothetical protein
VFGPPPGITEAFQLLRIVIVKFNNAEKAIAEITIADQTNLSNRKFVLVRSDISHALTSVFRSHGGEK